MKNGFDIDECGNKFWFKDYKFHREDGPAIEYGDGTKAWFLNDKRHREDGPAIEYFDGRKSWFLNDIKLDCSSQEDFEKLIKLKAFW
jgi:hypothetical protein